MRSALLLAALAALVCCAMAGPQIDEPGCYPSDSTPSFKIMGYQFVDTVKGQWVQQAFKQAKFRMRTRAEALLKTRGCDYDIVIPKRGCYNSPAPGKQYLGQYGFVADVHFYCGHERVVITCKARLHPWRDNRLGRPSFWNYNDVKCKL